MFGYCMNKKYIITIDGPAGSGKSSVARRVARKLSLPYIDTGAMYRALTYLAIQKKIVWTETQKMVTLAKRAQIDLETNHSGRRRVFINGINVTRKIRTPQLTKEVHHLASSPGVREQMVRLQRRQGNQKGGVLEGRDIGTVVFAKAPFKFYLDADFHVRAKRRFTEMISQGLRATLKSVQRDLRSRDLKDFSRKVGALKMAKDAVLIDTTALTIDEVVDIILRIISYRQRGLAVRQT